MTDSFRFSTLLVHGGLLPGPAGATTVPIVRAGDEILSSSSLFGGTFSLFRDTLVNFGVTVSNFCTSWEVAADGSV